jgi:hypothetical protein
VHFDLVESDVLYFARSSAGPNQALFLASAEAGHVPLALTLTSPSRLSRVPLISNGSSGSVDVHCFVKSFQNGSHDFAGAFSFGRWSCGISGVEKDVRRMYVLKLGVGRAYVTLMEVGVGMVSKRVSQLESHSLQSINAYL